MTARKSLPRYSLGQSRHSVLSQVSGILNPDSTIGSNDEEVNPLWFRGFENNSVNVRPSARFSLNQNDTPVLDSNSEPESTPIRKSWWKHLDNSPQMRHSRSNVSRKKSDVPERSNLEASDTSLSEEVVAKPRSTLRRNKRKSTAKNVFSEILESSEDENSTTNPLNSASTLKLSEKRRTELHESDDTEFADSDLDGSHSPLIMSHAKKRSIFRKTNRRKTANLDELLSFENDERTDDQPSMRGESEANQNKPRTEIRAEHSPEIGLQSNIVDDEEGSDTEESIIKQRVVFGRKKRKSNQEKMFAQLLDSPNTSVHSNPVSGGKKSGKLEISTHEIPWSNVERRSSVKRKSFVQTSRRLDLEVEGNRSSTKLIHRSTNANKSDEQRRSTYNKSDRIDTSHISNVEVNENRSVGIRTHSSSSNSELEADRQSIDQTDERAKSSRDSVVGVGGNQSQSAKKPRNSTHDKSSTNQLQMNKNRSRTQGKNTSVGIQNKSRSRQLFIDEEEAEKELSTNVRDRTQNDQEYSMDSRPQLRDASIGNKEITMNPAEAANENADQRKTALSFQPRGIVKRIVTENTPAAAFKSSLAPEGNISDGRENTGIDESRFRSIEATTQGIRSRAESSFSFADLNGTGLVQQTNTVSTMESNAEKVSQFRAVLEAVKKKEVALTTRIESYFKSTSDNKPATSAAAKGPQKLTNRTKTMRNQTKSEPAQVNKAYMVNGKIYKRPKLPRPKPWATDRLYKYLWKRLEPKYKLRTRIRSEKFIIDLSHVVALVVRRKKYDNYKEELDNLIHEMARLQIIKTRNDFNIFCQDFLPFDFRMKVIPMLLPGNVRNVPFDPDKLHTPILEL